jgi:ABC-type multidrug transport system ATPase subunit
MLSVNHVTKKYGNFIALEDISLEFTNGVYALLAPNGAGKTTLIKMLTTLIFPTSGEILWNGDEIVRLDASYRELLGFLPQDFGYYKNHSPYEFLLYLAALKGIKRSFAKTKVDELIKLVGLADVRNKKMRKFSGGMVQRVGIAQAMLNDPKILILDEPTAGLDPKERVRFRNLIAELSKDRIVILSTHIVSDIETIANNVIMFKDHKLFCCDTVENICKKAANESGKETVNLEEAFLHIYRDEVEV